MSHRPHPKEVEDYTGAFLASFGLLLFMVLWTIAAIAGMIWAVVTGFGLDKVIQRLPRRG